MFTVSSTLLLCSRAGEVLGEKQFTCPQAAPVLQAVSFLGCGQSVGGWNNSCHRHLEKPTGKAVSVEVTVVSTLPHNTTQLLLREHIHIPTFQFFLDQGSGKRGKAV